MPFGPFKDFNECVSRNQDKSSPEGYCGNIMRQIEGKKLEETSKELTTRLNSLSIQVERTLDA